MTYKSINDEHCNYILNSMEYGKLYTEEGLWEELKDCMSYNEYATAMEYLGRSGYLETWHPDGPYLWLSNKKTT